MRGATQQHCRAACEGLWALRRRSSWWWSWWSWGREKEEEQQKQQQKQQQEEEQQQQQHHEHAKSAPESSFADALVSDALLRVGVRERGTRLLSRRGYLQHHRAVKQK